MTDLSPEAQAEAITEGVRRAHLEWLAQRMTAPMTIAQFAKWFGVSEATGRKILDGIDGVVELSRQSFRVPVREMPDTYLLDVGLLAAPRSEP